MGKERDPNTLKGNTFWSLTYALVSIRNYPLRNAGIALILAIGIALPTTVFVWTETGTSLTVTDYFDTNAYQLSMQPKAGQSYASSRMANTVVTLSSHRYVEHIHVMPSTVGIFSNDSIPDWSSYAMSATNYLYGIKDMRVLLMTSEILGAASIHFSWRGNFSLELGQVLVSSKFVNYTQQVHGITVDVGSEIDINLLRYGPRGSGAESAELLGRLDIENLTVAGVYEPGPSITLLSKAFVSISRTNWDPLGWAEPVLGLEDSVIILASQIPDSAVYEVMSRGFFPVTSFIRISRENLMAVGAANLANELESFKIQLEETYSSISFQGFAEIWQLGTQISTFLSSQVLTVVVFPVMIMSLMLTVFTSESSVSRRRGEISALRSKGASFNQIFTTFMWESLFLALLGLAIGFGLSAAMSPLVGSSTSLFMFDIAVYQRYFLSLTIPILAIIVALVMAMYLPAAYLLHVARRIDVSEVGQPTTEETNETADESHFATHAIGLAVVLAALIIMPQVVSPQGNIAVGQILVTTLLLFVASYLGSKAMRQVTSKISGGASFALGEKSLYLTQSLRKRKGQFVPLLVILTLTLTTTCMMTVQFYSFQTTVDTELRYAIGADARVESEGLPIYYNRSLVQYTGIYKAMPVLETWARAGSASFYLEGVDAPVYSKLGVFSDDSFTTGDSSEVLSALAAKWNGIIISDYYSLLWNKTIGDTVNVLMGTNSSSATYTMAIVGLVRSAPGFGFASQEYQTGMTFATQFGFQVGGEGFALVNLDFLFEYARLETSSLFLVDTVRGADISDFLTGVDALEGVYVVTPETFDLAGQSRAIQLFLSGLQGLTTISFLLCLAMGLSAIALFLGSAVLERRSEYAIFRAMGATREQVVSMVFGEFAGSVVAAISISSVLGIIFGYTMGLLTFGISPFSPLLGGMLAIPFMVMGFTLLAEGAVMLLSCYIPARRAGSVNPASALRNL